MKNILILTGLLFFFAPLLHAEEENGTRAEKIPLSAYSLFVEGKSLRIPEGDLMICGEVLLLPLTPIAEALGQSVEYDREKQYLEVFRVQDKARIGIFISNGVVASQNKALGMAPDMNLADAEKMILPAGAAEILTGTHIRKDEEKKQILVELDKRLKPVFDFTLIVNDRTLPYTEPFPRSVGPVLLLPLQPLIKELGHSFRQEGDVITVTRIQDNAKISLDLVSGLIRYNNRPAGIAPDMVYGDTQNLLLPSDAVETLTGTTITVPPGTKEIRIDTDERLDNILRPRSGVLEEARKSPFVAERLDFRVGKDMGNEISLRSRFREFTSRFRYETPDFIIDEDPEPSWIDLKFESLDLWGGSFGDYNTGENELMGVNVSRVRGASFYKPFDAGTLVLVGGQPLKGSRELSDDRSVPAFRDYTAGFRFYEKERKWEGGISALQTEEENHRAIVANYLKDHEFKAGFLGEVSSYRRLDIGYFDSGKEDDGADLRGAWNMRFSPWKPLSLSLNTDYTGLNFNRSLEGEDPDDLLSDTDMGELATTLSYTPFSRLGMSLRYSLRRYGLFRGDEKRENTIQGYGASLSTQPIKEGPQFTLDYSESHQERETSYSDGEDTRFRATASQRFRWFNTFLRYDRRKDRPEISSARITSLPYRYKLPKKGLLNFSAGISGTKSGDTERLSPVFSAGFDSGLLLGPRTGLRMDYGYTYSLEYSEEEDTREDKSHFLSIGLNRRMTPTINLQLGFSTAFDGDSTVLCSLSGYWDFNRARRFHKPDEGKGVLTGTVFLDKNQDGEHQEEEKGIPGIPFLLRGTGFGVRTGSLGDFTMQNIPEGIYESRVKTDRLPLGYLLLKEPPMIRIDDSGFTQVSVPVILTGQIRGTVYEDRNGNGQQDAEEPGLEGLRLIIGSEEKETFTASFGQFVLDELRTGEYSIRIDPDFLLPHLAVPPALDISVNAEAENRMQKVEIGVGRK